MRSFGIYMDILLCHVEMYCGYKHEVGIQWEYSCNAGFKPPFDAEIMGNYRT